jgi:excisionase family DNA binding protein
MNRPPPTAYPDPLPSPRAGHWLPGNGVGPDTERGERMSQTAPDRRVEPLAYTVDEAAQATRLSRDLLYDEMRAGRLAYLKVGRRRIITRQHLEAFLTRRAS